VIGDTHYGSLYEAKDECAAIYERFRAEGVSDVLHAGDVIDGHQMYRGQEFEIHAHGWAAQRDWFAKTAPKIPGMTTHFITGNHDASMKKAAGIDVGGELRDRRPDWRFLGEDHATVAFKTPNGRTFRVMLIHPGGGSAYALSYRPQKITEQIEGGTKPNMLLIGNYHKAEWMPSYRNVSVIQVGCFQWQTPFMVTKGLAAHVGGWIVRVTVQEDKLLSNSVRAEFVSFFSAKA
jgi:predicted phosphodiesterase